MADPALEDPVDVLTWAAETTSVPERVAGYRRALALLEQDEQFWSEAYAAAARARALCGLARDHEVPVEDAMAAVEESLRLGSGCAPVHALVKLLFAEGRHDDVLAAARKLPKSCFRSELLFMWRFHIWNFRAASAYRVGRVSEGRRYAKQIVATMRSGRDEEGLLWVPPFQLVEELARRGDAEAVGLLRQIADAVDIDDWFGGASDVIRRALDPSSQAAAPSEDRVRER